MKSVSFGSLIGSVFFGTIGPFFIGEVFGVADKAETFLVDRSTALPAFLFFPVMVTVNVVVADAGR